MSIAINGPDAEAPPGSANEWFFQRCAHCHHMRINHEPGTTKNGLRLFNRLQHDGQPVQYQQCRVRHKVMEFVFGFCGCAGFVERES